MPIYNYVCNNCGNKKELLRTISSRDKKENCCSCKSGLYEREVSSSPFHLHGDGWAADGYADSVKSKRSTKKNHNKQVKLN